MQESARPKKWPPRRRPYAAPAVVKTEPAPPSAADLEAMKYVPPVFCGCRYELTAMEGDPTQRGCIACGAWYVLVDGAWTRGERPTASVLVRPAGPPPPPASPTKAPGIVVWPARVARMLRLVLPFGAEYLLAFARDWESRWERRCDNCMHFDLEQGQYALRNDPLLGVLATAVYSVEGRPYVMSPVRSAACLRNQALVRCDTKGCEAHGWRLSEVARRIRPGSGYLRAARDGAGAGGRPAGGCAGGAAPHDDRRAGRDGAGAAPGGGPDARGDGAVREARQ
jgi:hypothetical protein